MATAPGRAARAHLSSCSAPTISMLTSPSAYGWVNRTLDDSDLDSFVDTLVRRLGLIRA